MADTKQNPIRILTLIDQFYPITGGAEQQALRISLELRKKGHDVTVLTRQSRKELPPEENCQGIKIYRLAISGVSGASKLLSTLPAALWLIRNRKKYDIIHCHGINPFEWGAMLAALFTAKPYVVKIPLSNFLSYAGAKSGFKMKPTAKGAFSNAVIRPVFRPALKFTRKRMITHARRVFSISPEISSALAAQGIKNIVSLPNGIDTEVFCPVSDIEKKTLRHKLKLPPDDLIFIYSGRLAVEKNLRTLLLAWQIFSRRIPPPSAQLIILGDGKNLTYSTEDELRAFAGKNKMSSISFEGAVANVPEYLQASDVFVLPSYWEGMSNALLESMACGLPAIVSDIPGNRSLVEDGMSGLLFDPEDVNQFAECIERLAGDVAAGKKMGTVAGIIAKEKYSLSRIVESIISEYENVLAESKKV